MSYRNFLDEIKKGLPSGNYVLISSDPFLHSEACLLIRDLVPEQERDFNFHVFDLLNMNSSGMTFDQILDVLNTVPFFTGRKIVVIENSQKLLKKDLKKLQQYLQNPSESSVMILLHAGTLKKEMKDSIKGLRQIILDISERDMPAWLKVKAGTKGFSLADSAADYLIGTIGPDLGLLSSELDKCALIGKEEVRKEDIMDIIEGKRTYNAFALVDAIRARDTERVFKIYRVLKDTEEPYSLLGALNWQYSRSFGERDTPQDRAYYYQVFQALHRADLEIKSSGGAYPMELLLIKLIRLSKGR
ncbi:MAG: DNA polymerase III subunit delta [Nitrospirae bacterium]|nr:DNA polymerase III subunit delta [Nitrospirota bacterium]